jgi:hypothetical protein
MSESQILPAGFFKVIDQCVGGVETGRPGLGHRLSFLRKLPCQGVNLELRRRHSADGSAPKGNPRNYLDYRLWPHASSTCRTLRAKKIAPPHFASG